MAPLHALFPVFEATGVTILPPPSHVAIPLIGFHHAAVVMLERAVYFFHMH